MKRLMLACSLSLVLCAAGCAKKDAHYYAKMQGLDFGFAVTSGDLLQQPNKGVQYSQK